MISTRRFNDNQILSLQEGKRDINAREINNLRRTVWFWVEPFLFADYSAENITNLQR